MYRVPVIVLAAIGQAAVAPQAPFLVALEKGSLIYEVKDGPYDPSDDKFFASWAPAEGDAGTENYKNALLRQMNSPLERGWGCVSYYPINFLTFIIALLQTKPNLYL